MHLEPPSLGNTGQHVLLGGGKDHALQFQDLSVVFIPIRAEQTRAVKVVVRTGGELPLVELVGCLQAVKCHLAITLCDCY